jgi:hypothetical protein
MVYHERFRDGVRKDNARWGFSYMYTCGSCRGAAVTIMEPWLVCVWQTGPLSDFSFNIYYSATWDIDTIWTVISCKTMQQEVPAGHGMSRVSVWSSSYEISQIQQTFKPWT